MIVRAVKEYGSWLLSTNCHMGSRFVGALAYDDNSTLLAPAKWVLLILISVCENYAAYRIRQYV